MCVRVQNIHVYELQSIASEVQGQLHYLTVALSVGRSPMRCYAMPPRPHQPDSSACEGLLYGRIPCNKSDLKTEASRAMLEAEVGYLAQMHTHAGQWWSFWAGREDICAGFSTVCTLHDISRHQQCEKACFEWENTEAVLQASPIQYILCNHSEPSALVFQLSNFPAVLHDSAEIDSSAADGRQLDADKMILSGAASVREQALRPPESSITVDKLNWQVALARGLLAYGSSSD